MYSDISISRAMNIVWMGGARPEDIHPARWAAIAKHIRREYAQHFNADI